MFEHFKNGNPAHYKSVQLFKASSFDYLYFSDPPIPGLVISIVELSPAVAMLLQIQQGAETLCCHLAILHGPSMDWHTCFYIAELVKWTNWFTTVHHWNEPSNIFRLDSVISVFSKNLEIMWSVDKLRSYPIAIIFAYVPGPQSGPWGHNLCL